MRDLTGEIVAAKRAKSLSFQELSKLVGIEEDSLAELIFRRRIGTSDEVASLTNQLGQEAGQYDGLIRHKDNSPTWRATFIPQIVDKIILGVLASVIIFTYQSCQTEAQRITNEVAAAANTVSSVIRDNISSLVSSYQVFYGASLSAEQHINDKNQVLFQSALDEVRKAETRMRVSINVLQPFMSAESFPAESSADELLKSAEKVRQQLETQTPGVEAELSDASQAFMRVTETLQPLIRAAVRAQYTTEGR